MSTRCTATGCDERVQEILGCMEGAVETEREKMMDPTYKTVLLLWAKDLAETAIFGALAWPVLRRSVKKYFADLRCPHCGKTFGFKEAKNAEAQTVREADPDLGR